MNKVIIALCLCLAFQNPTYANPMDELPDEFYVTQHWISSTTTFDLKTKKKKLGTLHRRMLSLPIKYDFYDTYDKKITTAKARFFTLGAHFDVYDNQDLLLGTVEEKILTIFPSFTLYSSNGIKLAQAEMNFWGTQFTVVEAVTGKTIATMTRPYFRLKNNWTILIKNKQLVNSMEMEPHLLMTVLAFQCDDEEWSKSSSRLSTREVSTANSNMSQIQEIQNKIEVLLAEENLESAALPSEIELEKIAQKIDEKFTASLSDVANSSEKLDAFTTLCFNQVQAEDTPASEKKAILYLLQQTLSKFNNQD